MPLAPQITNTPVAVVNGSDFVLTNVANLQDNITTFYQTSAPGANAIGDTWFDTDDANKQYRWDGSSWVSVQDGGIATATTTANAASAAASTAQATANTALTNAATAYTTAVNSLQPSAYAIQNPTTKQLTSIDATGLTVYSGASATSGARVVLNSTGLAGFNSGGSATFSISASTGAAVFSGSVTGSTITGGTLNIGGNAIIDSSGFLTATGATITGTLTSSAGTIGGFTLSTTGLTAGSALSILTTGQITGGNTNTIFYGFANIGGGSATGARLIVAGTSELNGNVSVLGNITATNSVTFGASTQQFEFLSSSGNVRVAQTYGNAVSGRAMQISSAGLYGTTASTERKKHNITPYAINQEALLQLEPITFNYLPQIDEDQNPEYGFIAEEADRLGLYELTGYDKDGLPDYFAYEKLPIFLLQIIKNQEVRIKALEGK